jgi:hypothetical protein
MSMGGIRKCLNKRFSCNLFSFCDKNLMKPVMIGGRNKEVYCESCCLAFFKRPYQQIC